MHLHMLVFVQVWGLCGSLDIDLRAKPLPEQGNRLRGFTRYACESGVGEFRKQQRACSFLVPPTVLTKPAVQYLAKSSTTSTAPHPYV